MNPYLAPSAADCAEPRAAAGSQDTLTQAPAVAAAEPEFETDFEQEELEA